MDWSKENYLMSPVMQGELAILKFNDGSMIYQKYGYSTREDGPSVIDKELNINKFYINAIEVL